MKKWITRAVGALLVLTAFSAQAQLADRKVLTLAEARKAVAAGLEEARKNNWPVAVAVVDDAGVVISLDRLDNTQRPSVDIAIGKARTAALFRRPSAVFEENINKGRTAFLSVDGYIFVQGGIPIVVNGETLGAVGVSGVQSFQDEQVAKAGAAAIGK